LKIITGPSGWRRTIQWGQDSFWNCQWSLRRSVFLRWRSMH